jgi:vancomycin resistance protein YoaR
VKVSGWTVRFTPGESNGYGANIRIPARNINGTVIAPGQVFSFLQAVGPIDEAHGFKQGGVIINGRSRPTGAIGGGICSASTTMFNAALRAGLEIVERRAHYYFIDRYPVGLDATVFSNGSTTVDLRWRNDSRYPVLIRGYSTSTSVTFEIWTVPDGRRVRLIPTSPRMWNVVKAVTRTELVTTLRPGQQHQQEYPADGYETLVRRVVVDASGKAIHRDAFRSRYSKVDGLLHIGARV